ncbi:MAG: hypothetical protein UW07_C0020G0011 [Candidatus Nomurabacteria bacterium GW2011_GWF2_43_8]|uniref:EamA domain-containing protein n=3 Tax=Candidatus Nomuraibacteriota TaxID=1752729 RepID=A0A0G1FN97_9BACT|nr:MAG: hypothetical protein UW07_C0020G0011 [Candidatus Nomurabacteria bacterium GW2011_GWF2_43_8]
MGKLSPEKLGESSVMLGSLIWSFFPILTILSYSGLEPVTSLAWTTLISILFFFIISLARNSWESIFRKDVLLSVLGVTFINGILFYALFFIGLKYTTAGNAAIVATMEILFSYLFFNVWRKEYIDSKHIIGVVLMFLSAVIILSPNISSFQTGDLLILLAVFIVPLGNLLQKNLRAVVTSDQILFYRTLIATPFLFLLAYILGEQVVIPSGSTWIFLLINGLVLFGLSKILWIEGIFRISVTKAISISGFSPIFTLIFAFFILKNIPSAVQLIAAPLAMAGIYLLTRKVNIVSQPMIFPLE